VQGSALLSQLPTWDAGGRRMKLWLSSGASGTAQIPIGRSLHTAYRPAHASYALLIVRKLMNLCQDMDIAGHGRAATYSALLESSPIGGAVGA
jgi:hypothetical protein